MQDQFGQGLAGGRTDLEAGAAKPKPCSRPAWVALGPMTG
jgi:hypothetical protein